jgi:outer membrane protein assembly factor BamB
MNMKTRREFGRLVLGGLATATAARALDWPQFRGPNQDGVSTEKGILQDWPAGGPKLLWDVTGVGNGYSAVSTAGDRIATCGEVGGQSSAILLSAKDGSKLWLTPLGQTGTVDCCNAGGPRVAPTIDAKAGLVFAIMQYGEAAALNWSDGKPVWKKHLVTDLGGKLPKWGFSSAPVADGDRLLLTIGGDKGMVTAVDKKTANVIWQSGELLDSGGSNDTYATLVIATIDGVKQYVQLTDDVIAGLNPADGKVLWKAERQGRTANIPTPVVFGNFVYVSSGYGVGCSAYEVKKSGAKWQATELWKNKAMVNHHGGVVRVGPNVYGHSDSKGWTCQDIKTGNVLWQEKTFGKGSITYADNRFVIRDEGKAGSIALIEASPNGYKEHGRFDPTNRSKEAAWPHPVISNGRLYIRDEDHLQCYDIGAKA